MKIKNVRGVVWDLDGTLIDSFKVFVEILEKVVAESGHPMPTHEKMIHNYHGSLHSTLETILHLKSQEEVDDLANKFLDIQYSYYADADVDSHFFEDAVQLAKNLAIKGIPQMIITNRDNAGRGKASPGAIIAASVLADCIDEVRAGDEVIKRKPDPLAIDDWFEMRGIDHEDIVVIGDQAVDAELARNVGGRAVLVARDGKIPHLDESEDVIVVPTLHDIEIG